MLHRPPIPKRLPVMTLSGCNLLPHGLLPLHIFEPCYRMMLEEALQGERMFCIGTLTSAKDPGDPADWIHPASTAGFIRACVAQPDGCSNLLLQGLQRIRLTDFQTDRPYATAAVTPIKTVNGDPGEISNLVEDVRSQAIELMALDNKEASRPIQEQVCGLEDPEMLGDLIGYHFIDRPEERHLLLETACLHTRLAHLKRYLERLLIGDISENSA
ncbi:MAG: LON peptidase substrate-binding domain-containing protein [Verrucomicrobiales bacterium]|nr:LON peptidase substrate-binding domain-containing protein [Verrucomicrobiales bacterium]